MPQLILARLLWQHALQATWWLVTHFSNVCLPSRGHGPHVKPYNDQTKLDKDWMSGSVTLSERCHLIKQFVWGKWPAVLIKPKSYFHTNQISSVSSVSLLLMHQWSSQFVLYLMVGFVFQLCITGCRKCWSYAAVLRCAVILRDSLALPLLRLFRRPRTVAFRPLLSETSKLRRKDSER